MANNNVRALPNRVGDDFTEVVIRVPNGKITEAWADLADPIKDSPDYQHMHVDKLDGVALDCFFEDDELKLLAGVFLTASEYLPMGPHEFVRWVDRQDAALSNRDYVDEYIGNRMKSDSTLLWQFDDDELNELAERITASKAERVADRVKREELTAKEAKFEEMVKFLSEDELDCLQSVITDKIMELHA